MPEIKMNHTRPAGESLPEACSFPPWIHPDRREIRPLTGIRGVAAAYVVLFHFFGYWSDLLPALTAIHGFANAGLIGVDLFFVLSGFIMAYVYSGRMEKFSVSGHLTYLWHRIARIYPNHLATLLIIGLIVFVEYKTQAVPGPMEKEYSWFGFLSQIFLVHSWPGLSIGVWNYPAWSISAEWFAYLAIFPVMMYLLRFRFSPVVFVLIGYAILLFWVLLLDLKLIKSLKLLQVTCEFAAGAMIFGASQRSEKFVRFFQKSAVLWFFLILAILVPAPLGWYWTYSLSVLLFPILLVGLTTEKNLPGRFLATPGMVWLGKISYALYMTHAVVQNLFLTYAPPEWFRTSSLWVKSGMLAFNIVALLLAAAALYYWVEVPARRYLYAIGPRSQKG